MDEGDSQFTLYEGLKLDPMWLTVDPGNGIIDPNGAQTITINADINSETLGGVASVEQGAVAGAELAIGAEFWSETILIDIVVHFDFTDSEEEELPHATNILRNYPNPFNPTTTISFDLTTEISENTELCIYNVKGQKIKTYSSFNSECILPDNTTENGQDGSNFSYSVIWDGKDDNDRSVPSGVYFYKLKNGSYQHTRKMLLLK